jgi:hypothetical protein
MTSRLPRFDTAAGALVRSGADRLVRPLPPTLVRLLAETDEAKAHADVAERFSQARTKATATREALAQEQRRDEDRLRDSLAKGTKEPKPQAPAVEAELEDAERKLRLLDGLVIEYATALLREAVERLPEALKESQGTLDAALDGVRESLENAVATLALANEAAAEHGWLVGLNEHGHNYPFSGGKSTQVLPGVSEALARARQAFDGDLERQEDRREETRREREVEERLPLPPGAEVWKDGKTFRVIGEKGELQEVEEVER